MCPSYSSALIGHICSKNFVTRPEEPLCPGFRRLLAASGFFGFRKPRIELRHGPKMVLKPYAMKIVLVPLMLLMAGLLMSFAWIGHLRFRSWSFLLALVVSWFVVLPEYLLTFFSVRLGRDI